MTWTLLWQAFLAIFAILGFGMTVALCFGAGDVFRMWLAEQRGRLRRRRPSRDGDWEARREFYDAFRVVRGEQDRILDLIRRRNMGDAYDALYAEAFNPHPWRTFRYQHDFRDALKETGLSDGDVDDVCRVTIDNKLLLQLIVSCCVLDRENMLAGMQTRIDEEAARQDAMPSVPPRPDGRRQIILEER